MGHRNIKHFLNLRTKWILCLFFAAILSLFIGTHTAEAQVKIDNKKLQTSPTSKVQVKGKKKRSKKRRGDRRVSKKEKKSPRETNRAAGVYEKPHIRTSGRKGERATEGGGSPRTTAPNSKVESVLTHPGTRPKKAVKDALVVPRSTGRSNVIPDTKVYPRTTQRSTETKNIQVLPRMTQRKSTVKDIQIIPRMTQRSRTIKDIKINPRTTQRSRIVKDVQIIPRGTQRSNKVKDIKIIPLSIHRSGIVKDIKIGPRTTQRSSIVRDVKIVPRSIHRSGIIKDIKIVPRSIHPSEKVDVLKYKHPGTKRNTAVKDVKIVPRSISEDRGLQDPLPQLYAPSPEAKYKGDRKPHIMYYDSRIPNYKGELKAKKKLTQDKKVSEYAGNLDVGKLTIYNESYNLYSGDDKYVSKKKKTAFYHKATKKLYGYKGDHKPYFISYDSRVANYKGNLKLKERIKYDINPSGRFESNEKKSILTKPKNKIKELWFKIFKRKEQPEHLRDKDQKPKHDPNEKEIWNY